MSIKRFLKKIISKFVAVFRKPTIVAVPLLAPNELLKGRTALVTGATSGIGFAIAEAFVNAGATVLVTGRNQEKLKAKVQELQAKTGCKERVFQMVLDVVEIAELKGKIERAIEILPNHKIDILVNNAGIGSAKCATKEERFDCIMNTNVKSVYFLSGIVARHMIDNKIQGNILNIASSSSLRPAASIYGISKWSVRGLTEGLARLLIPHGIVVNAVGPGPTATPFMGKQPDDDLSLPRNPAGRFATPEEVANMAVVLTSGLGRMVVGDIIYLSGGAGVITCDDIDYVFK